MNIYKRLLIILLITIPCVGCDQGTKLLAAQHLPKQQMLSYFNDFLRIGYTENIGAFLGLGNSLAASTRFWIFVLMVGSLLALLFFYLLANPRQNRLSLIALSLTFAGGLSNFYDRIVNHGAVIDFVNLGLGPLRTGVFNVADMAIILGLCLFVFSQRKVNLT